MKKIILLVLLSFFCFFTSVNTVTGIDRATSKKTPLTVTNTVSTSVNIKGKLVSKKPNKSLPLPGILELLLSKFYHQQKLVISKLKPFANFLLPISNVFHHSIPTSSFQTSSLDPNQASKVLIFYPGRTTSYLTANIVDGSFSIEVSRSNPIGMIFVDTSNKFLGYLYLKNNIASLPMSRVKAEVATIDLGELFLSGLVVEPENNPLGTEIPLTEDERKALEQFNGFFASIVKNPDIDGNGVIDFLEDKRYFTQIIYHFNSGKFGSDLTASVDGFEIMRNFICFFLSDSNCADSIIVSGPPGSPFSTPRILDRQFYGTYCSYSYAYSPDDHSPLPEGAYTVNFNTDILTFQIPDQSPLLSSVILLVPTVTLNEDRTIKTIKWVYRLANGSDDTVDPTSLIKDILINITSSGTAFPTIIIPSTSTTEVEVPYNIPWDEVHISTSYTSVYGDIYGLGWQKNKD